MKQTKNKKNQELKKLIKSAVYLSDEEKNDWERFADTLNPKQINEVNDHFQTAAKDFNEMQLKVLYKVKMADKYRAVIKEISNKYKNKAMKKEEGFYSKQEANPEEILKKLNEVSSANEEKPEDILNKLNGI